MLAYFIIIEVFIYWYTLIDTQTTGERDEMQERTREEQLKELSITVHGVSKWVSEFNQVGLIMQYKVLYKGVE